MRFLSARQRFLIYHRYVKPVRNAVLGTGAVRLIHAIERMDRKRAANAAAAVMRRLGPLLPEHRLGRHNLRLAFPEKSDAEIERILIGAWDNLARVAVEFTHLHEFCLKDFGRQTEDVVGYSPETLAHFHELLTNGKPAIIFAAHLANWELPALAASSVGAKSAVLFRRPNIPAIADAIVRTREPLMGSLVQTTLDAPIRLARLLQSGAHVGMLVDQHFRGGVEVMFFGRRCLANPLLASLARQTECRIHGIRVVRLPNGNSFWGEFTGPIDPPRDRDGRIAVQDTMQVITSVIEGWVREHPEQWLWLHRRWRPQCATSAGHRRHTATTS